MNFKLTSEEQTLQKAAFEFARSEICRASRPTILLFSSTRLARRNHATQKRFCVQAAGLIQFGEDDRHRYFIPNLSLAARVKVEVLTRVMAAQTEKGRSQIGS